MEYITTKEASKKWGISTSRITLLANEGRIPGAYRLGKSWLIPATATKPPALKPNRSGSNRTDVNDFSLPLYHFRPDWNASKESLLSEQEQKLLLAETAVLECRYADAYPLLESILSAPDDINIEIGCLWNAGLCYLSLNKPKDFSRIFLRLQMILAQDFPHKDNLFIILDLLSTYIQTVDSAANINIRSLDIHEQCLPLICVYNGYVQFSKEAMKYGVADTTLLELNLRLLETTGVAIAVQLLHCHLLGIYYLRQDIGEAEKHARAIVQIAYENKFYFPLVSYYSFFAPIISPILSEYPEDFRNHCQEMIVQYENNYSIFFSSLNKYEVTFNISTEERSYVLYVLMGLNNACIAEKMGVSPQTVKRRLSKICETFGVETRKELLEYLRNYI